MILNEKVQSTSQVISTPEQNKQQEKTSTAFDDALKANKKSPESKVATKSETQIEIEENKKILEDIFALIQTGLTKTESQELDKLMQRIKQGMRKKDISDDEMKGLLQELENLMLKFQKRLNGQMIKTQNETPSKEEDLPVSTITDIVYKLEELAKKNEEMKTYNRLVKQHDELEYLEKVQKAV